MRKRLRIMANAKDLLDFIKARTGLTSKVLAGKLGYNATYFSRGVRGEDSSEIEKKLRAIFPDLASDFDRVSVPRPAAMDKLEQAMLKVLVRDHLRLKADVTGRPIDELMDEFDLDTRIVFRGL